MDLTIANTDSESAAPPGEACSPHNTTAESDAVLRPTPTINGLPQRLAGFDTLTAALDYAAEGTTGYNFYNARGQLEAVLPYSALRQSALSLARHLSALNLERGDRVGLVADTSPEFILLFFACRYAGLTPFTMPIPINRGSHRAYVEHLHAMLVSARARAALATRDFHPFLQEAVEGVDGLRWSGTPEDLKKLPAHDVAPEPNHPDETAYLQFTSGSTRKSRAVIIPEHALMSNLRGIARSGVKMRPQDRCASWLPFYHDMGLVGLLLCPLATQLSVDFLATHHFAVRPIQWLRLISANRCTIAFGQPFGYRLCSMRARASDMNEMDLSSWRIAGVGAELIRPGILRNFAEQFAQVGFDPTAFLPCYGLAEVTLALSFARSDQTFQTMQVDSRSLMDKGIAVPIRSGKRRNNEFVNCGSPLPDHRVKITDDEGQSLPELRVGRIFVEGPSVMSGYFNSPRETHKALGDDGWLDTGDIGFLHDGELYLTGRLTDLIIVNGRNILAQDIEELAEQQKEVRARETSAFSVETEDNTLVVVVVESRLTDPAHRQSLVSRLQRQVYETFGVHCLVELVAPHTLPRTSSGKLSRSAARLDFIRRSELPGVLPVQSQD